MKDNNQFPTDTPAPWSNPMPTNESKTPWPEDAPVGMCWQCPDCDLWATLGGNAGFHRDKYKHGQPVLKTVPMDCQKQKITEHDAGERMRQLENQNNELQAELSALKSANGAESTCSQIVRQNAELSTLTEANRILKEEITKLTVLWHDATEENKKLKEELKELTGYLSGDHSDSACIYERSERCDAAEKERDQLKSQLAELQAAHDSLRADLKGVESGISRCKANFSHVPEAMRVLDWIKIARDTAMKGTK